MNGEAKEVFTPELMITFRTARKLRSYLVRVKLCRVKLSFAEGDWLV